MGIKVKVDARGLRPAIRRLKRTLQADGHLKDQMRHRWYQTPAERKRASRARSARIRRRAAAKAGGK